MPRKRKNTEVLSASISCINKKYLEDLKEFENINISRYVDTLITADRELRKNKWKEKEIGDNVDN